MRSYCIFALLILSACEFPHPSQRHLKPAPVSSWSPQAQKSEADAELLHEMYTVVFLREPEDRSEFGSLVDSLNQGASLEGVYNGLVHSGVYRRLEVGNPGSTRAALRVFAQELSGFEAELPTPTSFDAASAQPLSVAEPVSVEPTPPAVVDFTRLNPHPSTEDYMKIFMGASVYTLKRVLGDEALKVIESKEKDRPALAVWYSKWAVQMTKWKVDFGLALRNKPDEAFHDQWALTSSLDRLRWEVLNRTLRVLNAATPPR